MNRIFIFDYYCVVCKNKRFGNWEFEIYDLPYSKAYEYFCEFAKGFKYSYLLGYGYGKSMLIHKMVNRGI